MELRIDAAVDGLRLGGGVDAARLAGLNDFAHHAAIVGDPQFAVGQPQCRSAHQRMVWPIPEEDAGPIGPEQSRGRLGHLRQQRLDLVRLVPLAGDFQHGFQPPQPPPHRSPAAGRL